MSSVPNEVLRDVLRPLDRCTLDDVQFTDARFLHVITNGMSDVCLRKIHGASFTQLGNSGHSYFWDTNPNGSYVTLKKAENTFSEFVQAVRSSRVALLCFHYLVVTPEHASLVVQTPIVAVTLKLDGCSCDELTAAQFHAVLLHFSPASLHIDACRLRACQINDGLVRALSEKGGQRVKFENIVPVDGDRFGLTDEAIADFCVQPDVHLDQEGDAEMRYGELEVENGSTTKNLFKRLVQASALSPRTHPLRIYVYPSPVEVEDLGDFAQHHSYMFPSEPEEEQEEMYDFPGKPHGADAAMDLQIVVRPSPDQLRYPGNSLIMIRAQRPHDFFFAPYDADQ